MAEHTHTYSKYAERDNVTHDHKAGGPHIHDGLEDDAYLKNVKAAEKRRSPAKGKEKVG